MLPQDGMIPVACPKGRIIINYVFLMIGFFFSLDGKPLRGQSDVCFLVNR